MHEINQIEKILMVLSGGSIPYSFRSNLCNLFIWPVSAILTEKYGVPYNCCWDYERSGSRGSCTCPEAPYPKPGTAEEQKTFTSESRLST